MNKNNQNLNKYYRYQMTFPFESNKIHKSKSLKNVVRKCYGEFKSFSDINEGMFCVTNLDKNVEYRFKIKNKKIQKLYAPKGKYNEKSNILFGGNDNNDNINEHTKVIHEQVIEINKLDGDIDSIPKVNNDTNILLKLDLANKNIDNVSSTINNTNKNVNDISLKIDDTNKELGNISSTASDTNKNINDISLKIDDTNKGLEDILGKLSQPEKPQEEVIKKEEVVKQEEVEGIDLFDGIDIFDFNYRKLNAIKKMNNIEKHEKECTIL